jgi:hypothetical protein
MTKDSLKVEAYDILATISRLQMRLQEINTTLASWKDNGPEVGTAQAPKKVEDKSKK